jgi:trehalose 6-phosphate synthase
LRGAAQPALEKHAMNAPLRHRFSGAPSYIVAGAALLMLLTLALAPLSRSVVEQWSRRDAESRARLAATSIEGPVQRALADGDTARLASIIRAVTMDDRIVAVGVCDENGVLRIATTDMPSSFSCNRVARAEGESFSDIDYGRQHVMIGTFPIVSAGPQLYLVVLHDLSFAEARSGQVQTYVIGGLLILGVIAAGIAAVLTLLLLRRWMESLRLAINDVRAGRRPLRTGDNPTALDREIQRLLRNLETGRAPTEPAETQWTPQALQDLMREALPGAEVIIVSNREPYIHNQTDDGGIEVQRPASGLVSALEPVMQACGGTWIAHGSGSADKDTVDAQDRISVPPSHPAYTLRRVWVSDEEQDGYYYGFANEGLWPLCHIAFVRPVFRESDWAFYERINARFAEAVAREAQTPDPIVLVQDYHFALAPRMIRALLPKATIITFWHIPWPNAETFGICPWKERILEGLLGSSIIGFHTQFHCNNFLETVDRFIESRIDREHAVVTFGGADTKIRPYPISIAWPPQALKEQPPVSACRLLVRERLGLEPDAKIAVGIERFDYTKGILDRMHSIDFLLETMPGWKGRLTFVQVAAPTRSKLANYSKLQRDATLLAQDINRRHGWENYQPIRLLIRHHEPDEVFELFRAADICIVSSLHDGMNLVAKEFVASRDDNQGVLVLSSFTGASRELAEALIVNPFDVREMAKALDQALRMPPEEQRERMRLMRQQVREQNVYRWAARMMIDAARLRQEHRIRDMAASVSSASSARR